MPVLPFSIGPEAASKRKRGGTSVSIPQNQVKELVREMAGYGFYLETSSAVILGAVRELIANGEVKKGEKVMGIATSHGFKNMPG